MLSLETWELLSYIVTVFGLPMAIFVFLYEHRKDQENEEEEIYQLLSDNYQDFLKVALDNPDLGLFKIGEVGVLTDEQLERQYIIFAMLTSLFERAYLVLYEDKMTPKQARFWNSWDDSIKEWCSKLHFRANLPKLLQGEDPDFVRYIEKVAEMQSKKE